MTRLVDRMLGRTDLPGYNEQMFTGAYQVSAVDGSGRGREPAAGNVARQARRAIKESGLVFGCLAAQMALFSEVRFKLQALTDMHLYGDTSLSILEHPWPGADTGELLARSIMDVGWAGNFFLRLAEMDGGADAQLVQMRPDQVTIISREITDRSGNVFKRPVGYAEDRAEGGADPQIFTTDEVAHFSPIPDPDARWRGMSWLTPLLREIHADQTLTSYKTFHLDNGAMPGLVVKYSQKLSDPTVETLKRRMRGKYGGPENAGNVLVLDEGADLAVAGSTLEQLQLDVLTKAGERRVAEAAQIPLEVLGLETGNYQEAVRRWADLWARPWWRMFCASVQHLVPDVPQPVRLWYDVAGIAALREGELARGQTMLVRAQALTSMVMAGFTRESAIAAADSGDLTQLKADPNAPPPGVSGRETASERLGPGGSFAPGAPGTQGAAGAPGRPPQAAIPENLPGVVRPNTPNAFPQAPGRPPALANGARGSRSDGRPFVVVDGRSRQRPSR